MKKTDCEICVVCGKITEIPIDYEGCGLSDYGGIRVPQTAFCSGRCFDRFIDAEPSESDDDMLP